VLLIGFYALRAAGPPVRLPLLAGVLATPLHAASLFLVRMPLHGVLVTALPSGVLFWVASLYAPLLEEPAKWLVLFLPFIRARLTPANAAGIALAVGLGFGLGEIVNLAALTMLHAPETCGSSSGAGPAPITFSSPPTPPLLLLPPVPPPPPPPPPPLPDEELLLDDELEEADTMFTAAHE
jgi:hypothetical protein